MSKIQTREAVPHGNDFIPVAERWIGSWRLSLDRRPMSGSEVQKTYDGQASRWNSALRLLGTEAAYYALCATVARDLTVSVPGQCLRVLDAGSGTGALSSAFLASCRLPTRLHALDASPHMLAEAQRTYARRGVEASLHLGDVRKLPFENASMDVVLTAHVLEHLADPQQALADMMRVLRPGGLLLLIGTKSSPASLPIRILWRTRGFVPDRLRAWIHDAGATDIERLRPTSLPIFNRISLAFLAKKPLRIPPTE